MADTKGAGTKEDPIQVESFDALRKLNSTLQEGKYYKYTGEKEINMTDQEWYSASTESGIKPILYFNKKTTDVSKLSYLDCDGLKIRNIMLSAGGANSSNNTYTTAIYGAGTSNNYSSPRISNLTLKDVYTGPNAIIVTNMGLEKCAISTLLDRGAQFVRNPNTGVTYDVAKDCSFYNENLSGYGTTQTAWNNTIQCDVYSSRIKTIIDLSDINNWVGYSGTSRSLIKEIKTSSLIDVTFTCLEKTVVTRSPGSNYSLGSIKLQGDDTETNTAVSVIVIVRFDKSLENFSFGEGYSGKQYIELRLENYNGTSLLVPVGYKENSQGKVKVFTEYGKETVNTIEDFEAKTNWRVVSLDDLKNPQHLRNIGFPIGVDS